MFCVSVSISVLGTLLNLILIIVIDDQDCGLIDAFENNSPLHRVSKVSQGKKKT